MNKSICSICNETNCICSTHMTNNDRKSEFNSNFANKESPNKYSDGYLKNRRMSRRQSQFLTSSMMPNVVLNEYSNNIGSPYLGGNLYSEPMYSADPQYLGAIKSSCADCGNYAYLIKCASHCDRLLCEQCRETHWHLEIQELINVKAQLENSVIDMRKYLESKRKQCNENIKSGQQIKKFINLTMQQIRRKIELELENKRDELYEKIDSFVESQKKINSSIHEDGFCASDRICQEIENFLLMTENQVNLFKIKSLKGLANLQIKKLEKQRMSKIPFYSIFFVPDSAIHVSNSFGKVFLKTYDEEDDDEILDASIPLITGSNKSLNQSNRTESSTNLIKSNRLYKWNSTDNLPFENRTYSTSPLVKTNITPISTTPQFQDDRFSSNRSSPYSHQKDATSPQIFITNQDIVKPKPRNKSQPAPVTKTRSKQRVSYQNYDEKSIDSSTEDYFSAFKSRDTKSIVTESSEESDDTEISRI